MAAALQPRLAPSPILNPFPFDHRQHHHHHRPCSVFLHNHRRRRVRSHCRSLSIPEFEDHHRHGPVHSLVSPCPQSSQAAGYGPPVDNKQYSNTTLTSPRPVAAPPDILESLQLHDTSLAELTHLAGQVPCVHSLDMATIPRHASPLQMPVPDSPPELSSSKSSKSSSSFRSSILSDSVGPDGITHFEDISLNDSKRDSYDLHMQGAKDVRPRPQARPMHSMMSARKKPFPTVDVMRSVHTTQRRPGAPGRPNGVLDDKSTNLPVGRMPRPGYRTGSGSFAPASPTSRFIDSRSPSPSKGLIANNRLVRSSTSAPSGFLGVGGPIRSKTWQPGQRKTVKQLEDEYHDSDEDVPEDAIIWNVPISPLSRDPSPRRKSSQSSISSDGKSLALDRHQSAPGPSLDCIPQSPRHMLPLPRSATTGSFPDSVSEGFSIRERHQSWTKDLSDDARHISAALEAHASEALTSRKSSSENSACNTPQLSRSSTSVVSLPPIQRSNIMIDPLPISKEKEAVLTRTRPSWLPPKSKKEERRHVKEWERMMAQAAVADRRRAAKQLEEIEIARISQSSTESIWEGQILPNWDQAVTESRTRELWWRGVDSKNRGNVWKKAIGNELQLSSASYVAALKRSSATSESMIDAQIKADAASAFPETGLFATGSPLHSSLVDILKAHASYRPDVGYVSGMHRIAALLLLNMSAEDAFVSLANVLNRPLPLAFMTNDKAGSEKWVGLVMSTLKVKLPALHDHLLSERLSHVGDEPQEIASSPAVDSVVGSRPSSRAGSIKSPSKRNQVTDFIAPMLSTMFTANLDVELLSRVWDIYVFESDKLLIRAFTGLCSRVENKLYGSRAEVLAVLGAEGQSSDIWRHLGEIEGVVHDIREAGKAGKHFVGSLKKA
ncbi:hypothetical protein K461DRAFT_273317 [Myriangium duriaei CBS 260.36]|uniref:Rab-GAP TBC domain-containing protein n=1 Tax=Myriangium duriaei CBS 260.36 TaxID=1168546 RepID=A0A9P4J890_9PEZI|nr:hypothetical protein K461DRAFT_273317 [Myriangium duriaei CBS 260.36]